MSTAEEGIRVHGEPGYGMSLAFDGEQITVRWDDGSESTIPTNNCHPVDPGCVMQGCPEPSTVIDPDYPDGVYVQEGYEGE